MISAKFNKQWGWFCSLLLFLNLKLRVIREGWCIVPNLRHIFVKTQSHHQCVVIWLRYLVVLREKFIFVWVSVLWVYLCICSGGDRNWWFYYNLLAVKWKYDVMLSWRWWCWSPLTPNLIIEYLDHVNSCWLYFIKGFICLHVIAG